MLASLSFRRGRNPERYARAAKFYGVPCESLLFAAAYLKEPQGNKRRVVPCEVEAVAESARFSNSEWKEVREFMAFWAAKRHRVST